MHHNFLAQADASAACNPCNEVKKVYKNKGTFIACGAPARLILPSLVM